MNVLFHTVTSIATIVLVAGSGETASRKSYIWKALPALVLGVIFHSILDYMPHCYPINSKVDVIVSLLVMILLYWKAARRYKLIVAASFVGNVLPDIIDLLPAILNKFFHLDIIIAAKLFPWHWPLYSGSIYSGTCNISNLNHLMVIVFVGVVCWYRRRELKAIFLYKSN